MIQTVRGNIEPEELGLTMSHEHLCVDLSRVRNNTDSTFGYSPFIVNEVNKASLFGVKSYVELTTNDMGRNVEELRQISEECDVHIIAATGFYMDMYHSEELKQMNPEQIAELFIKELTVGIADTSIKAGVIGEVASSAVMTESERRVLEGAAIAQKKVGCAISTHCQLGTLGRQQAAIFNSYGVNPAKVVLGHIDLSNDTDYMIELLDMGFNIAFDTIGKTEYLSDEQRVINLKLLLDKGYGKQIVISQDISRKSYFTDEGYYGFTTVMEKFVPMLKDAKVSQADLDAMLITNPQRIFNFE